MGAQLLGIGEVQIGARKDVVGVDVITEPDHSPLDQLARRPSTCAGSTISPVTAAAPAT